MYLQILQLLLLLRLVEEILEGHRLQQELQQGRCRQLLGVLLSARLHTPQLQLLTLFGYSSVRTHDMGTEESHRMPGMSGESERSAPCP